MGAPAPARLSMTCREGPWGVSASRAAQTWLISKIFFEDSKTLQSRQNSSYYALKNFSLKCVLSESFRSQAFFRFTHAYGSFNFPKILGLELVLTISLEVEF